MKRYFLSLKDNPKMIMLSDWLTSILVVIMACILTPVTVVLGLAIFKLYQSISHK